MLHLALKPWARDREMDIDWFHLSRNTNATQMLAQNQDKIHWGSLSRNPGAVDLLAAHPLKIDPTRLAKNPSPRAMTLLEPRLHELCKDALWTLSKNPVAVPMLERSPQYIDWAGLCSNPAAVDLIARNLDKADWYRLSTLAEANDLINDPRNIALVRWELYLSENPHPDAERRAGKLCGVYREPDYSSPDQDFVQSLLADIDPASACYDPEHHRCIIFSELSANPSPRICEILGHLNPRRFDWRELSANPSAIPFLEKHPDRIDWNVVWRNPAIFEEAYDYEGMKASTHVFKEELVAAAMHPRRLQMWLAAGGEIDDF